jgi:hypothetical protein
MELESWTPFSGTLLKTLFKTMVVTKEQRSNFSTKKMEETYLSPSAFQFAHKKIYTTSYKSVIPEMTSHVTKRNKNVL